MLTLCWAPSQHQISSFSPTSCLSRSGDGTRRLTGFHIPTQSQLGRELRHRLPVTATDPRKSQSHSHPVLEWRRAVTRGRSDMPRAKRLAGGGTRTCIPAVQLQSQFARPPASLEWTLGYCLWHEGDPGGQQAGAAGGPTSPPPDAKVPLLPSVIIFESSQLHLEPPTSHFLYSGA